MGLLRVLTGCHSILWISGWSIPPAWLAETARRQLPHWTHRAIAPSPSARAEAEADEAGFLGGFSFGAHLLLASQDPRPRILLAPFPDLKSEAALGGAVAAARIRRQLRDLRRDPSAAVADFRRFIGASDLPGESDPADLAWGLGEMLAPAPAPRPLPAGSLSLAGASDPLLDLPALRAVLPDLRVVACGHEPEPLLAAAAAVLQHGPP